ncbi:ATP phosphoribosyltransferase 1, chloroplastic isoform X2 [Cryptomeria japonica]|uniref:ATP phosphoribosyltransferase 1, chloroplastic isoform X2 n=1 Tax=Cryptomeria japonica TaxID=3369 RepID=UPI0027DAA974|nr:ATP phosphoribosyltransferase 1, chloroplastic isoform X2 [Cryptomeria japonica]
MALSNLFSHSSPKTKFNGSVEQGLRSYKKLKYSSSSLICVRCHCSTTSFSTQLEIRTGGESKFFHGNVDGIAVHRSVVRLGLPSKGRMAEEILALLKDCQLGIRQANPRQYVAHVPGLSNLEVWFQRPKDIVRKLMSGDLDLGIIGYDTVSEHGQGNEDLILVHDALEFGQCRLSLAIPNDGIYKNISTLDHLAAMPQWTTERPLRIATGYTNMGIADAILDLVSSGTTLHENNLKEIEGGLVLNSQGVFVANKKALVQHRDVLEIAHEMLERLEAHLKAVEEFKVTANMRGSSAQEVAEKIFMHTDFHGFQGPTVGPVYWRNNGEVRTGYYAIMLCVPKQSLYKCVRQLRAAGGSGVLVSPLTYIFDEEPSRWRKLLDQLNL